MAASTGPSPKKRSPNEQKAELAQVLPAPQALASRMEHLRELQDQLLQRSLQVLDASVRFAEVEADTEHPPPAWIDELGEVGAQMRLRIARASWMSAKESPVGIKVAANLAVGILRAKAQENAAPRVLHLEVVHMTAPMPQFPEQEIEPGR